MAANDAYIQELLEQYSPQELDVFLDAEQCERDLATFYRRCWHAIDPEPYEHAWFVDAIADHLMAVTDGDIRKLLINCPPRHGKACAHDTPVLTAGGWRCHGDLRPGDIVFGPDGRPAPVVALSPEVHEVVPVTLTNGDVVRCHPNHEWTVYDRGLRRQRTMETRALARTKYWSGDRARFQLPDIAPIQHPIAAALPVHPYFLGAWLGDGSTGALRIAHGARDHEVVEAITACGYAVSTRRVQANTGVHYADFSHNGLRRALTLLGVLHEKHIPQIYLRASVEQRLQLLAGLIDTDGSVDHKGRVIISTSNQRLRDGALELCASLALRPYVTTTVPAERDRPIKDRKIIFQVGFQPNCSIPTRIPRKRIVARGARRAVGIRDIGPVERGAARSIQVARPDGLYLVGKKLNPTHNTNIVSIAWPCWTWAQAHLAPLSGPQVSFLTLTYASKLALDNAIKARRLIASEWYQDRWGDRVLITPDKDSNERFDTTVGGTRISTGFDGSTLGRGGGVRIIDDPHKVDEVESDTVREHILKVYRESLQSRVTDPRTSAEVIIMQRLHEHDLSGYVLEQGGFTHLMLPAEYDPTRHCATFFGGKMWQDPRGTDPDTGEQYEGLDQNGKVTPGSLVADVENLPLWPERFTPAILQEWKNNLGPYAAAGQLQQSPAPRGGGLIQRMWWQPWRGRQFPDCGTVIASLDTAIKEKEQNDYNALTVWGAFAFGDENVPKIILRDAWRGRLSLAELVTKTAYYCRKHNVDYLLIEDKTRGHDVAQEIRKVNRGNAWTTLLLPAKGDKVSRVISIQHLFSGDSRVDPQTRIESFTGGVIFAPVGEGAEYDWVDMVISEFETFPSGKHDDLVDSGSQALRWMRDNGVVLRKVEHEDEERAKRLYRKPQRALYDV